MSQDNTPARH